MPSRPALPGAVISNRRKHARYHVRLMASYQLEGSEFEPSAVTTVSREGCSLVTGDRHLRAFSRIQIEISLPSGGHVTLRGLIAWTEPPVLLDGSLDSPGMSGVWLDDPAAIDAPYYELIAELDAEATRGMQATQTLKGIAVPSVPRITRRSLPPPPDRRAVASAAAGGSETAIPEAVAAVPEAIAETAIPAVPEPLAAVPEAVAAVPEPLAAVPEAPPAEVPPTEVSDVDPEPDLLRSFLRDYL